MTMKAFLKCMLLLLLTASLCSCYFFRKRGKKTEASSTANIGTSIGNRASGANNQSLAELYAISTTHAPAAIRPDPDLMVRRLLLQYRSQGSTVAREIGRVESYRLLLGGASEDFSTTPAESYDATSLLANLKVAQEICQGLVAPTAALQPGWNSILPSPPSQADANIRYLAQRFTGLPSSELSSTILSQLRNILDAEAAGGSYSNDHYTAVCSALLLDASSLYF